MYDLVSVNAYGEKVEQDMAMGYGDVFLPKELTPYALADFAHRTGINTRQLSRELTTMAKLASRLAPELAESDIYIGEERDMVRTISTYVKEQAVRLLALAHDVPKVSPTLFE